MSLRVSTMVQQRQSVNGHDVRTEALTPPVGGDTLLDILSLSPTLSPDLGKEWKKVCDRPGVVIMNCKHGVLNKKAVPCKSWRCRSCSKQKVRQFVGILSIGLLCLDSPVFMTTTWHLDDERTLDAEYVRRCQEKLVSWIRGRTGQRPMYCWVREVTKKGQLHIHWILSPWMDNDKSRERWHREKAKELGVSLKKAREFYPLAEAWRAITKGTLSARSRAWEKAGSPESFVVDVSDVRSPAKLATYVAKYMVKDMRRETPFGRRFGFSKGWPRKRGEWVSIGAVKEKYKYQGLALESDIDAPCCPDCERKVFFLMQEVERGNGTKYIRMGLSRMQRPDGGERVGRAARARRVKVTGAVLGAVGLNSSGEERS